MGENRPSDVFFALWFYRARSGGFDREEFRVCAEAWRALANREAEAEILRCAAGQERDPSAAPQDDSQAEDEILLCAAGQERDPSAAPQDDKGDFAPQEDSQAGDEILRCAQDDKEKPQDDKEKPQDDKEKMVVSKSDTAKVPDRWAAFKASAAARLERAREDGVTFARLAEASGGSLNIDALVVMAGRGKIPIDKWSKLDKALTDLGYPREVCAGASG